MKNLKNTLAPIISVVLLFTLALPASALTIDLSETGVPQFNNSAVGASHTLDGNSLAGQGNPYLLSLQDISKQEQIQALLSRPQFSEEVWKVRNSIGRKELALQYAHEVAQIMGVRMVSKVVVAIEDSPKGYLAEFCTGDFSVHLYPKVMKQNDWEITASAIVHELRHAYQFEVYYDHLDQQIIEEHEDGAIVNIIDKDTKELLSTYEVSPTFTPRHPDVLPDTKSLWAEKIEEGALVVDFSNGAGIKDMFELPLEYDAWLFAGQLELELFKKMLPSIPNHQKFLKSINAP
ncbi:MAG: hypothetical protein FWD27_04160 [Coriobacteriia bacterium]|nr:hypothetical protein [Coriobacteriia bacterium]